MSLISDQRLRLKTKLLNKAYLEGIKSSPSGCLSCSFAPVTITFHGIPTQLLLSPSEEVDAFRSRVRCRFTDGNGTFNTSPHALKTTCR